MKTGILNKCNIISNNSTHMKSKQAIFEEIISSSIKKVRDHIVGGVLEEFE